MKIHTFILLIILLLSPVITSSQGVAVGQWRDHLPYNKCIAVTEAKNNIYCATPYNVFYYDKDDNSINRLTKVSGLSDIGVSAINYHSGLNTLIIAYSNTNIDLIKNGRIINVSDIKRKQMLGNKTIYNIELIDKYAYLSCGFGIVVLDIEKYEILDTYFIGPEGSQINVFDLSHSSHDSTLYAATESGVYSASLNSPNLADYSSWVLHSRIDSTAEYNLLTYFDKKIFVNKNTGSANSDTIFYYDGIDWNLFDLDFSSPRRNLRASDDQLLVSSFGRTDVFDINLDPLLTIYKPSSEQVYPQDAIIDKDGYYWIADRYAGLVKVWDRGWKANFILPNGPATQNVFSLSSSDGDVWVAPGGRSTIWGTIYNIGIYSFKDEIWNTLNQKNISELDSIVAFVDIGIDPSNSNHIFAPTWGFGLCEFKNNALVNIYNHTNSSLQAFASAGTPQVRLGGVCYDQYNNLWVSNSNVDSVLSVKQPGKDFQAYYLGSGSTNTEIGDLIIDSYDQAWILMRYNNILVFNYNYTINNPNDDLVKKLDGSSGNGSIPGSHVFSIAEDLDGEIWIGTDEGVAVIYSPGNVFSGGDYDAQKILVEEGGYAQYLLESESVTAIAIDGANRKWFGTDRAGVFLMSDDGTEQLLHFTEDNSPLLSNSISSITINQESGEVFFGTSNGIISYKGTATAGGQVNQDVYAYPNPVREGYNGTIAIKGLVNNADIKITDISGNLIFSTKAEGGQAVWNGKNFDGRKAKTGVYLVFVSNEDGSETIVTKILFIN
jgi:streptogramin lyase